MAETLPERVAGIITRYSMASPGDHVGVAVSGGADSVVLLHVLRSLSEALQIRLVVLHLNHQLRGSESDGDEEFVRATAKSLKLPIVVERAEIAGDSNLEQAARLARMDFHRRCIDQHGLQRIALGHTRSDQAETVLFRFLRGSGTTGLAAMRMVTRDGVIRPLLTTSREEVRSWAVAQGIAWREDSSNSNLAFSRNRLREEIIPALAQGFNSNLEAGLARASEFAQDEEDYWFQQVEPIFWKIVHRTHSGLILDVTSLSALHIALQRRVIRRTILDVRGDLRCIEMKHVDAILGLCSSTYGHDRVIVPGVDGLRSYDKLRFTRPGAVQSEGRGYRFALNIGEECQLPFQAGRISLIEERTQGTSFCDNFKEEQEVTGEVANLDGDTLASGPKSRDLYVRNWEPGDALQRPEHSGPEKIKSLFQKHRVLLWERRHWPVVVCGEEIVWARRFGSTAKFEGSVASRRLVRLSYRTNQGL